MLGSLRANPVIPAVRGPGEDLDLALSGDHPAVFVLGGDVFKLTEKLGADLQAAGHSQRGSGGGWPAMRSAWRSSRATWRASYPPTATSSSWATRPAWSRYS